MRAMRFFILKWNFGLCASSSYSYEGGYERGGVWWSGVEWKWSGQGSAERRCF